MGYMYSYSNASVDQQTAGQTIGMQTMACGLDFNGSNRFKMF